MLYSCSKTSTLVYNQSNVELMVGNRKQRLKPLKLGERKNCELRLQQFRSNKTTLSQKKKHIFMGFAFFGIIIRFSIPISAMCRSVQTVVHLCAASYLKSSRYFGGLLHVFLTNWQDYITISSSSSPSSPWSWSSWSSRWSSSWSSLALAWIACEPPKGNCTLEITVAVSHQCFPHHRHHHRHHNCYYNRHHHCHHHCHHYCHHHCHHHLHCHHHHYCRHP